MDNFILQGTEIVPSIQFDAGSGLLKISGRMVSINAVEYSYFGPLLDWVNEYALKPAKKTNLVFDMDYCSSGGIMIIHQIIQIFNNLYTNGFDVSVTWKYSEDDEDTEEKGFQFQDLFNLPIELVSHP
jgi:hypothetical protein